jgi:Uma2 family endonuclease
MNSSALTWEAICADRSLRDLPYKIETNRYNQIVMSPATNWHSDYQANISDHLRRLMTGGQVREEFAIETDEGVRVPDVMWVSKERRAPHRRKAVIPIAPEICVEVLSQSNSRAEMIEKMRLYFARGAEEVWLCDEDGRMQFFSKTSSPQPIPASVMCPGFPQQIDTD